MVQQENTYDFFDAKTGAHVFIAQEYSDDCNRCLCKPFHSLRVEFKLVRQPWRRWSMSTLGAGGKRGERGLLPARASLPFALLRFPPCKHHAPSRAVRCRLCVLAVARLAPGAACGCHLCVHMCVRRSPGECG